MEKVKAPEHCPFHWCHNKSFASCLGVDAERKSDGVRREKSRCESYRPGESSPVITLYRYRNPPKLLDVAEGLGYLHANNNIHGNLNGASIFFGSFWASLITLG